jgi:hypothetical protein
LQNVSHVARSSGNHCEPQVGSLPLVLIPNFGGSNLKSAPGPFEDRLDDGPFLLQGVAGGEMEGDVESSYVRGISRSS